MRRLGSTACARMSHGEGRRSAMRRSTVPWPGPARERCRGSRRHRLAHGLEAALNLPHAEGASLCLYDGDREVFRAAMAREADGVFAGLRQASEPARATASGSRALRSGAGGPIRRLQTAGRPLRLGVRPAVPTASLDVRVRRRHRPARAESDRRGAAGRRPRAEAHRSGSAHYLRTQSARLLAPEPGNSRERALDLRGTGASGIDRPHRGPRRDRRRNHARRRFRRRAAPASARPLERVRATIRWCSAFPTRGSRPAAGPRCGRRPTRCMPRESKRSSTSSSTTMAKATSSGRPCRSAASTTQRGSASIPGILRPTSTIRVAAIASRSTGRLSSRWRSAR